MMSEILERSTNVMQREIVPDYLGYYMHEVAETLSHKEDFLSPCSEKGSELSFNTATKVEVEDSSSPSCSNSDLRTYGFLPFFCNGFDGLTDFQKEKLKASVSQSVEALNHEIDELLDHVLALHEIQTNQGRINPPFDCSSESDREISGHLDKKRLAAVSNCTSSKFKSDDFRSSQEVDRNIQLLLENYKLQSEEALKGSSTDLLLKLEYFEKNLEEFLRVIMSRCRVMTTAEKHQLCKRIQWLPAKALDRVVEILQHKKPSGHESDGIHVDLEEEDNVTLWRLHYCVKAVEIANEQQ